MSYHLAVVWWVTVDLQKQDWKSCVHLQPAGPMQAFLFFVWFFFGDSENEIKWGNAFLSCLFAHLHFFIKNASTVSIWSGGNFHTVCLIKPWFKLTTEGNECMCVCAWVSADVLLAQNSEQMFTHLSLLLSRLSVTLERKGRGREGGSQATQKGEMYLLTAAHHQAWGMLVKLVLETSCSTV